MLQVQSAVRWASVEADAVTPSGRCRQLVRQWGVLRLLQSGPASLQELRRFYGVNDRTIRRDLEALEAAGFPLYNERHEDNIVRWHLMAGQTVPQRAEGGAR